MFFESILDVKVHVYYYVLGACSTVPSRTTNESDDKFQSCESFRLASCELQVS